MPRLSTILTFVLVLLLTPLISASMRVYQDCTPSQRFYIANVLETALANIELVVRARDKSEDRLEVKHFGVLDQAQKEMVTEVYARALHNRPTLTFTCPKHSSELEKICEASLGPEEVEGKTGYSLMARAGNELLLCSAPEAGVDLNFVNKVAIVSAIIKATLEEQ